MTDSAERAAAAVKRDPLRDWRFIVLIAALVFSLATAIWTGFAFIAPVDSPTSTPGVPPRTRWHLENFGQLGDAMAPITAVASTASFFVVFVALLLQTRELALQRRALKLQRIEMKEQRRELAGQRTELEQQTAHLAQTAAQQERAAAALERAAAAWERTANAQDSVAAVQRENAAFNKKQAEERWLAELHVELIKTRAAMERACQEWDEFLDRIDIGRGLMAPEIETARALSDFKASHLAALLRAVGTADRLVSTIRAEPPLEQRFDRAEVTAVKNVLDSARAAYACLEPLCEGLQE